MALTTEEVVLVCVTSPPAELKPCSRRVATSSELDAALYSFPITATPSSANGTWMGGFPN